MKVLQELIKKNKEWSASKLAEDPDFFLRKAKKQEPRYLWIGCSDSRVPASNIIGTEPGELFVHRNVANLFPYTDFNSLSVLEFAVERLQVQHIIVCGHYGCGGIKAAMEDSHLGLVDNWLRSIRDVYHRHREELDKIKDLAERANRLSELNAQKQVANICHTTVVQKAWQLGQKLMVHGWVYSLETGLIKDLNCSVSSVDQIHELYRITL